MCGEYRVVPPFHNAHVKLDTPFKCCFRGVDVGRKNIGGNDARHATFGEECDERKAYVTEALRPTCHQVVHD